MQGLPEDSLTFALANGNRELHGYSRVLSVLKDVFDAINVNTQATGNWKSKPPNLPLAPRPKVVDREKPKKPVSVAELYSRFVTAKSGG